MAMQARKHRRLVPEITSSQGKFEAGRWARLLRSDWREAALPRTPTSPSQFLKHDRKDLRSTAFIHSIVYRMEIEALVMLRA